MNETSHISSATSRIPTNWPAKARLKLILRLPMQIRPQLVTRTVRSWNGYSGSAVDDVDDDVRERLSALDGVLVWVDPITSEHDRSMLDPMLRDVAVRGVWVSAHPDIILKMGTKDVLYRTRGMGCGTNTRLYATFAEFRDALPRVLGEGRPWVLKQYRGNGGNGVWKVEAAGGERGASLTREYRIYVAGSRSRVTICR